MTSLRQLTLQRANADANARRKAWEEFRADEELQRNYRIRAKELEALKREALLGDLRCRQDFIIALSLVRRGRRAT